METQDSGRVADRCIMVIFGASGDLTTRMLLPALYNLVKNGHVSLAADKHYYSVPYRFIGKKIKLMYSRHSVEIFYHYERIAIHKRL